MGIQSEISSYSQSNQKDVCSSDLLQQVQGRLHLVCEEVSHRQEELLSLRALSFSSQTLRGCRHQQRWSCQQGFLLQVDRCRCSDAQSLWIRSRGFRFVQDGGREGRRQTEDVRLHGSQVYWCHHL